VLSAGKATLEILTQAEADRVEAIEAGGATGASFRVGMEVGDSAATGAALAGAGMKQIAEPVKTPWGHVNVRLETAEGVQVTLFSAVLGAPA
jgi:lactoylglutathione lyase